MIVENTDQIMLTQEHKYFQKCTNVGLPPVKTGTAVVTRGRSIKV